MTKYILAGGYMHTAADGGAAFCQELVRGFADGMPLRILDCLFARNPNTWNKKFKEDQEFYSKHLKNFKLELAAPDIFLKQVRESDIVFFEGGIPRQLISLLGDKSLFIEELEGKVLAGTSGGADAICTYYAVGKTSNIGEGLGLLPIKFIPYWESDYGQGLKIDWDGLRKRLQSHKEDLEIVLLREGEFRVIER